MWMNEVGLDNGHLLGNFDVLVTVLINLLEGNWFRKIDLTLGMIWGEDLEKGWICKNRRFFLNNFIEFHWYKFG
jgi:hypothetical protein